MAGSATSLLDAADDDASAASVSVEELQRALPVCPTNDANCCGSLGVKATRLVLLCVDGVGAKAEVAATLVLRNTARRKQGDFIVGVFVFNCAI